MQHSFKGSALQAKLGRRAHQITTNCGPFWTLIATCCLGPCMNSCSHRCLLCSQSHSQINFPRRSRHMSRNCWKSGCHTRFAGTEEQAEHAHLALAAPKPSWNTGLPRGYSSSWHFLPSHADTRTHTHTNTNKHHHAPPSKVTYLRALPLLPRNWQASSHAGANTVEQD